MKYSLELLSETCVGLGHYPCNDTRSRDGRVFVPVAAADGGYALYSADNGVSWERRSLVPDQKTAPFIQLQDGSFLAAGFGNAAHDAIWDRSQKKVPFCLALYRANSMDDVVSGRVETSLALVDIPGLACGFGDSGNSHSGAIDYLYQLSNGDIVAMMYGQFHEDTTLCPYFDKNCHYKFYLYRVWIIVSHDLGKTWEFLCTVADCQTYPIRDINAEGYCEPYCLEVEPGHLCAILRTGGHEVVSPLYCTHSFDWGKTWEAPYEICSWGVLPKLIRMQDGTLVMTSGHEHNFLMFSEDLGRTWSEPVMVEECFGQWGNSPSGYNTIIESRPGELTVIFDDPKAKIAENAPDGYKRQVYIRRYRLHKAI